MQATIAIIPVYEQQLAWQSIRVVDFQTSVMSPPSQRGACQELLPRCAPLIYERAHVPTRPTPCRTLHAPLDSIRTGLFEQLDAAAQPRCRELAVPCAVTILCCWPGLVWPGPAGAADVCVTGQTAVRIRVFFSHQVCDRLQTVESDRADTKVTDPSTIFAHPLNGKQQSIVLAPSLPLQQRCVAIRFARLRAPMLLLCRRTVWDVLLDIGAALSWSAMIGLAGALWHILTW